jgi:NO-binding membrane sensor protein with MHYT domain
MGNLYGNESVLNVVLVTGLIGGGAAWLAGQAIAGTWRPIWHAAGTMLLLGAAVRFVHFALFEAELLSPTSYIADTAFLLAVGCLAWRTTRTTQMVTQYPWLYVRSGPFNWRRLPTADADATEI